MTQALSVSQLTDVIRNALAVRPELEDVLVEGEISNFSTPASGHLYFTLKDKTAQLGCVAFRMQARMIPFRPENGMTVVAHGHVEVYAEQGRYQLYIDRLEPAGIGALALAVEQRKKALSKEGLFDEKIKRPLPLFPRRVVVVTSRSGAALRDVINVAARRAPAIDLVLSPATVQVEDAAQTLVRALQRAGQVKGAEVVLLVRGGGSLEDLMPFNEESVARAIRACSLPVVTGVGHETDTTIADLCADKRAATPSAATEMVIPDQSALLHQLESRGARLRQALQRDVAGRRESAANARLRLRSALLSEIAQKRRQSDALRTRLHIASPRNRLASQRTEHGARTQNLQRAFSVFMREQKSLIGAKRQRLEALSPQRTLERGYSVTLDEATGAVVTSAQALHPRQRLRTLLSQGRVVSEVVKTEGEAGE